MVINTILIDDEPGSIRALEGLLEKYCPVVNIIGQAQNPIEGAKLVQEMQPDLVFLDIEMPYGNAFDMLDKLAPIRFEVIFVTAFNNYALKAFRYAAADYLLKPISIEELSEAVNRISERLDRKKVNTSIETLLSNLHNEGSNAKRISLPTQDGFRVEDINNIMYLHAEGSYTFIYLKDKEKILVSRNLKDFEDMLPDNIFCRIHHSSIININYVKQYFKGRGGEVEMQDGEIILISTRKKADFFKMIR
ncbi:MAG: LytTR family DNA-binding domain-containing protein [Chitinophagaceae bacterium]|jgi:two-component system LytT family response regulator|nr:LytTR family DNA-binding domain-containing protein [Chitinophagaceae bacterium]